MVTKKLRLKNINPITVSDLIKVSDVSINENYLFNMKLDPENVKLINHKVFDYYIKSDNKSVNVVLIKNKDEKFNRCSMKRLNLLAESNKNINFFHMYNTEKNLEYLNKKFEGISSSSIKSYPQLVIFKENIPKIMSDKIFLKFSASPDLINEELQKLIK